MPCRPRSIIRRASNTSRLRFAPPEGLAPRPANSTAPPVAKRATPLANCASVPAPYLRTAALRITKAPASSVRGTVSWSPVPGTEPPCMRGKVGVTAPPSANCRTPAPTTPPAALASTLRTAMVCVLEVFMPFRLCTSARTASTLLATRWRDSVCTRSSARSMPSTLAMAARAFSVATRSSSCEFSRA